MSWRKKIPSERYCPPLGQDNTSYRVEGEVSKSESVPRSINEMKKTPLIPEGNSQTITRRNELSTVSNRENRPTNQNLARERVKKKHWDSSANFKEKGNKDTLKYI